MKVHCVRIQSFKPYLSWQVDDTDPLPDMTGFAVRINVGNVVVPFAKEKGANRWTTEAKKVIRLPWWGWWAFWLVPALLYWPLWLAFVFSWPVAEWRVGTRTGYLGFKTAGFGTDWPWKRTTEEGTFLTPSGRLGARTSVEDQRGED